MTEQTRSRQSKQSAGYESARFNALRHGILSRFTVLPWENANEYKVLVDALAAEHRPVGPTEEHLVEEIAGILWRKRRLRLAENAAFRRGLTRVGTSDQETARAALIHVKVEEQTAPNKADLIDSVAQNQTTPLRAIDLLKSGAARAYEKALASLQDSMQRRWAQLTVSSELTLMPFTVGPAYTRDTDGLLQFLERESHEITARRMELENPEFIRDQSLGEAFDPDQMDGLIRYEVHLDRKLERMLSMLIRLKELRAPQVQ